MYMTGLSFEESFLQSPKPDIVDLVYVLWILVWLGLIFHVVGVINLTLHVFTVLNNLAQNFYHN